MSSPSSTHHISLHSIPRRPVPQHNTASSDDLELANVISKSLSHGEKGVLQIIDAPYDGTEPDPVAVFSLSDNVAEGMKRLPAHRDNFARILDVTVHSDFVITGLRDTKGPERTRPARDVLIKFLQDAAGGVPFEERRIFRWLNDPLLVNDIGSIRSQWFQRLGCGNANLYRLVNRTSLQQDPLDYDLHPRNSYLTCAQSADGKKLIGECV